MRTLIIERSMRVRSMMRWRRERRRRDGLMKRNQNGMGKVVKEVEGLVERLGCRTSELLRQIAGSYYNNEST